MSRSISKKAKSKPEPFDQKLYDRVKEKIYKKNPVHSAYRSGIIVKTYKSEFAKRYGSRKSPYKNKSRSKSTGLTRWFREKWRNQRGEIGYNKKGDVYRPTVRVTKQTPVTFRELSNKELERAKKEKKTKGHVYRFRSK